MIFEDGQHCKAHYSHIFRSHMTKSLPLEIETKQGELVMKLSYKRVKANARNMPYVNGTKIELKLKNSSRVLCHTNPLPWPARRESTETLEVLEFLGTCHTFSLLEITDNLQARFSAPKGGEFHLSKILLKSTNLHLQVQAAEWSVTSVKSELPDKTWMPVHFDKG